MRTLQFVCRLRIHFLSKSTFKKKQTSFLGAKMDRHMRKERGESGAQCVRVWEVGNNTWCATEDASFSVFFFLFLLFSSFFACLGSCVSDANVRCMKRFLFKSKGHSCQYFFFNLKMDIVERGPFYEKLQLTDSSLSIASFKLLWWWWIVNLIWQVLLFYCMLAVCPELT